ncbi:glycosyltransferase family 2 protein (plasmid) [Phaeobacter sp. BS23]|uniref:glycosyltransferase family 2 protein n=1 Tax=Phaeobacter sp. BS23 TaxID=2907239 RepID=UPI0038675A74
MSASTVSALKDVRILVVIPTLNEAKAILPCFESLLRDPLLRDPARATLVVADGGSTDGTQDIVRRYAETSPIRIHLLHNPDRIQSAGINRAVAEHGDGFDLLLRCDAHAIYPTDYATALLAAFRLAEDAVSVVVAMDSQGTSSFGRAAAWVVDTPLGSGGAAHRGGRASAYVDHGHHALMDLTWFRKVGGYDAAFSHNEDAELDWRLRAAGGRIWLAGDVRLGYVMRSTPAALWRQYQNYGAEPRGDADQASDATAFAADGAGAEPHSLRHGAHDRPCLASRFALAVGLSGSGSGGDGGGLSSTGGHRGLVRGGPRGDAYGLGAWAAAEDDWVWPSICLWSGEPDAAGWRMSE